MKKLLVRLVICLLSFTASALTFAQSAPTPASNQQQPVAAVQQPNLIPVPPTVKAQAYVLMDINSGAILAQQNMNVRRSPASLTKLMTLYLTERALVNNLITLNDPVLISQNAWQTGGSRMFVQVNTRVPVGLLTQGVIVDSGNDATMALAEYVGGAEDTFVDMMNQEAASLGMTNTHYTDPTGLPSPEHYSTARDLATLAHAIWTDFPQYQSWYSQKWLTYNGITQPNRNRLLWRFPGTLGMKTGHTDDAGYCLIAVANQNGLTLLAVVLGAPSDEARADATISLLSYGFRFYNSNLLYQANSVITKPRVWFGTTKYLPAGTLNDISVTTPNGQFQGAKVSITVNNNLQAPIRKGQAIGSVNLVFNHQTLTYPLVALADDPKGGFFTRFFDSISYLFHKLFGSKNSKLAFTPPLTANNNQQPYNLAVSTSDSIDTPMTQ
ncbi:MAG: hypothetical protein A3E87_08120 [Gammaproteobacteria bacterium RIFCSPHIGHO2_12_FULL_35_23]|nr:MAG: hypothetical protein A3E87_08120 [Gammaproteobacteria bacterium RIFCSPHIGHO2_12_FULL_35_23]